MYIFQCDTNGWFGRNKRFITYHRNCECTKIMNCSCTINKKVFSKVFKTKIVLTTLIKNKVIINVN